MKEFNVKDKVRMNKELLRYSANENWIGKIGEIIKVLDEGIYLVKWEHLENPIMQYTDFIESV